MSQSFQRGPLPKFFRIYWISSHLFYGGGSGGQCPPGEKRLKTWKLQPVLLQSQSVCTIQCVFNSAACALRFQSYESTMEEEYELLISTFFIRRSRKAREIAELSQFNDVWQYQCRSLHEDPVGSVKHHFVCVFYRKFYISIYQGHLDCSCHTFHLSAESCCEKHSKGVKPCNISNWVMMAIEAKMRWCLFNISQNSPVNQSSVYCFVSSSASCHFLWAHLT